MSRFFTTPLVAIFIILGLATASYAQDDANMPHPNTKSGDAAFMFTLGGLGTFNLAAEAIGTATIPAAITGNSSNVPIAGLGMKYFIGDDLALKILLAFGTTSNGKDTTAKFSTMQFGIAAIVEHHFKPVYSTSPYIGGGIRFGSASQTTAGGTSSEVKQSGTVLNIGVLAGFDWFFTRGIAIGAEYMLSYGMASGSVTVPSPLKAPEIPTASAIGIGLNGGGSVHALVYF